MSSLNFIGGEKGGVGKSVAARALAQYFIDRKNPSLASTPTVRTPRSPAFIPTTLLRWWWRPTKVWTGFSKHWKSGMPMLHESSMRKID